MSFNNNFDTSALHLKFIVAIDNNFKLGSLLRLRESSFNMNFDHI